MSQLVSAELIQDKIFIIRGKKVMLSTQLAELYGVEVKVLIQAVKRNIERFPGDFMYQLTDQEVRNLKSQIVISSWGGARRANPYAFTEQGIAMLSSVLRSRRAIQVNITIMRAFVHVRGILLTHKDLASKIEALELKYKNHDIKLAEYDQHIAAIFEAIKQLLTPPEKLKESIGFHPRK